MTDPAERPNKPRRQAIAVKGEDNRMARLMAKGQGKLADAIVDRAFATDVRVREDAALAQMLGAFDIDSTIPMPALDAVCAVLTHVYEQTQAWPAGWKPGTDRSA